MTCWIVVPVKAPAACKTRLAGVLDEDARRALVARMLAHVIGAARDTTNTPEIFVLGPSRHDLPTDIPLLADPGLGLNAALDGARTAAMTAGVSRLLLLSADLPCLDPDDVSALMAGEGEIAIAPDRGGHGTNALSLPLPAAREFRFAYGPGSFAAHRAGAARLGLVPRIVATTGLATDIDLPEDLSLLPSAMR